jgi:hypothetical protein
MVDRFSMVWATGHHYDTTTDTTTLIASFYVMTVTMVLSKDFFIAPEA